MATTRIQLELDENELDALHEALGDLLTKRQEADAYRGLVARWRPETVEGILQQLYDIAEIAAIDAGFTAANDRARRGLPSRSGN